MNKTKNIELQYPLLCYDAVFKSVFTGNENMLAKMISDITGLDYYLLEDNIILETNELPIKRKNEKFKRCDFIVRFGKDQIINIELNRQSYMGLIVKNLSYVFHIFSTNAKKGEQYNNNFKITQINLNYFGENNKELSKYQIREEDTNTIYSNNICIYELNIAKCHDLYYNKDRKDIPNYIKWGALLSCKKLEDIPLITEGILPLESRDIIMDKLESITNDDVFMTELEAQKWDEWEKKSIYNDGLNTGISQGISRGIEQGISQGISQGIEQNTITTIKSMLKKEMSYEDISDITNKTIDEIKEIENSMKE